MPTPCGLLQNIEDAAREAASTDITLEEVEAALADTTNHMEHPEVGGQFKHLYGALSKLRTWMQRFSIDPAEDSRSAKASFEALCRPRDAGPEERKGHGAIKMDGPRLQCVWSGGQVCTIFACSPQRRWPFCSESSGHSLGSDVVTDGWVFFGYCVPHACKCCRGVGECAPTSACVV